MAFAVKMIVAAVAALAIVSQVSCKPLFPVVGTPVATSVTTHHVAPAYPVASYAHYPVASVATTHVASPVVSSYSYPSYGYYGAKLAPAALSTYHYPAAAYPSAYHYGYPASYPYSTGLSSTTFHHPYSPYSTTVLHK